MSKKPFWVWVSLAFVLVNSLILLGLGILFALGRLPAISAYPLFRWGLTAAFLLSGVIFLVLFFVLHKKSRPAYYLALALFIVEFVLALLDQYGWIDLLGSLVILIPIILLIIERRWFLGKPATNRD